MLAAGCGGGGGQAAPEPDAGSGVVFDGGAVILSGIALEDGSGSLLATMSGKVPNFRVRRPATSTCPEITLRGHSSFQNVANPLVYVDGSRTNDTCILDSLRSDDVERVEVYPQGFTTRPGYGTHGPGLILVFMRSG
jgi:hypothetical protein